MVKKCKFLSNTQYGGMLVELMMTVALAALIIPFIFRYQQNAVVRARNIAITKQMENVQSALERYILENKNELMKPIGKNISRVKISELVDYGLNESIAENYHDEYQLRVLKSADKDNKSTLQGIVILNRDDISPLRTREIVNFGGGKFGFVEDGTTYGGFGAFHANASDFGLSGANGIVGTTSITRGNTEYLWRLPSENENDATMLSDLNLDGHNLNNVRLLDANKAQFEEKLLVGKIAVNTLTFANRATIDAIYTTNSALINGALSADSKVLNIGHTLSLADIGKFSSFYTNDLYVGTLQLNGFSVSSDSTTEKTLSIVGDMDLVLGRIETEYLTVGYTGSVTPRLSVSNKIIDSTDSNFYWDVQNKKARFADVHFPELSRLAQYIVAQESASGTISTSLFGAVSANTNATVGDYYNALNKIQSQIRIKYQQLNLK